MERSTAEQERDIDQRESGPETLAKDDVFHLLQNPRRRAVLRYLLGSDSEESVMRDVAEAVAAWEHNTSVRRLTSTERQRVYIALYQSHLPKLNEHDIIDYDQARGQITVRPLANVLAPYLGEELDAPQTLRTTDAQGSSAESDSGLLSRFRLASR